MGSRLFIVSCELTSGFSLNLAKKSKGMFGSLKDEDFLSPVSNVLGIWDKIKDVSSDFNFQISFFDEHCCCRNDVMNNNATDTKNTFTRHVDTFEHFAHKTSPSQHHLQKQN